MLLLEWAVLTLLLPPLPDRSTTALLGRSQPGGGVAIAVVWLVRRYQRGMNLRAYRGDDTDEVQAVAAWSTGYTGTTTVTSPPNTGMSGIRSAPSTTPSPLLGSQSEPP